MSVYTVHEPPAWADDASDPERFAFVRDGFSVWAFLLGPIWMLWHRLWLVLFCYLILMAVIDTALTVVGAPHAVIFLAGLLMSLLVGIEAATLRRFKLSRRGWTNVGVVSGADREAAERHFFEAWVREHTARPSVLPAAPPPVPPRDGAAPMPRMPRAYGVIGLFPEPGAQR
jgi:hypothetical protein